MKTRIGVLTSGGDCPGLNAVLRGVERKAIAEAGEISGGIGGVKIDLFAMRIEAGLPIASGACGAIAAPALERARANNTSVLALMMLSS